MCMMDVCDGCVWWMCERAPIRLAPPLPPYVARIHRLPILLIFPPAQYSAHLPLRLMAAPFTLKAAKMETRMIFTLGQYDNFHLMTVLGQCTSHPPHPTSHPPAPTLPPSHLMTVLVQCTSLLCSVLFLFCSVQLVANVM